MNRLAICGQNSRNNIIDKQMILPMTDINQSIKGECSDFKERRVELSFKDKLNTIYSPANESV